MNYFSTCTTVEDVKKLYRTLAMQHHPDRGGDTATMQMINAQYTEALKRCNGQKTHDAEGKTYTYTYHQATEQEIIDFIDNLLKAKILSAKTDAYLIGRWVWVRGDTKPIKETLKALHMQWHSKRLCWYWKPTGEHSRYSNKASFSGLAAKYGAQELKENQVTA